MQVNVTTYNIRSGAIRLQIPDFPSEGNVHIFQPFEKSAFENKGRGRVGEKLELGRSTGIARFYLIGFFPEFWDTHSERHGR